MRTLGDMDWINDYVGLQYENLGRSWEGVDCYGLCILVYREEFGIELPDWVHDPGDLKARGKLMTDVLGQGFYKDIETPQDGCFAVCWRTRAPHHMGMYFGGGILHAVDGIGVIYQPRRRFEAEHHKVEYGVYSP